MALTYRRNIQLTWQLCRGERIRVGMVQKRPFRVTLGILARTLIGPALERVYASPWLPCWGFSSARTACTPEAPASERAAHPSSTMTTSEVTPPSSWAPMNPLWPHQS